MKAADIEVFQSPSLGEMTFGDAILRALEFIAKEEGAYKVIIGTDSETLSNGLIDFVTALVVHHVGKGGVYFWSRIERNHIHSLRQRIYEEAMYSLALAQRVVESFGKQKVTENIEIHVDIGQKGPTRELINEVVGMIRGNGFNVKTKPDSFGASSVADRHT
jgi:predicted RNase H-related nuclease YkuK (DUF458 family)